MIIIIYLLLEKHSINLVYIYEKEGKKKLKTLDSHNLT
jgi:hypothetical protein